MHVDLYCQDITSSYILLSKKSRIVYVHGTSLTLNKSRQSGLNQPWLERAICWKSSVLWNEASRALPVLDLIWTRVVYCNFSCTQIVYLALGCVCMITYLALGCVCMITYLAPWVCIVMLHLISLWYLIFLCSIVPLHQTSIPFVFPCIHVLFVPVEYISVCWFVLSIYYK